MRKNVLLLIVISVLTINTTYSMQDKGPTPNPRATKLSLGYCEMKYLSEKFPPLFARTIESIESFWYDRNSCDNVVHNLSQLTIDNSKQYAAGENVYRGSHRSFMCWNFHILIGSAKAARDKAREFYKESDENLARMQALSRDDILRQAHVNLAYVKHTLCEVKRNNYLPFSERLS